MKKFSWRMLCASVLLAGLSGCVSTGTRGVEVGGAVAPCAGERVVVDEVIVVVDVSGSMYGPDKYRLAKELTRSFVSAMPEGNYRAGLLTFGGEWTNEWVRQPAVPLDRDALLTKVSQIKWQRGSTPLPVALQELQPGISQRSGRTAVVILSDGGADRVETLDIVNKMKATHDGDLCFYTVHLGHNCGFGHCCKKQDGDCGEKKECGGEKKECADAPKPACCAGGKMDCPEHQGAAASKCPMGIDCPMTQPGAAGKECPMAKDCKMAKDCPSAKGGETGKPCPTQAGCDEKKACGGCNAMEGHLSPDLRENGHALMRAIVSLSECGHAWDAEQVISAAGMTDMIHTIFHGPGDGDADGDGVPDSLDQCPNTPRGAKVDARGCWVIAGLNFDTDKSVIKPEFEGLLDEVAAVLNDNAGVNLKIHVRVDGHTDSRASAGYNQGLSERRAAAVKAALVKRGVAEARLTTQGFGESKPIASNKTSAGRYQNRRVELTPVE